MTWPLVFAALLAGCWGFIWAGVLQFTRWGQWIVQRRTWLSVVIGNGGTLSILFVYVDWLTALSVVVIFVLSSIGILIRSLYNEYRKDAE